MKAEKTTNPRQEWENEGGSLPPEKKPLPAGSNEKYSRTIRKLLTASTIGLWGKSLYLRQKRKILLEAGNNKDFGVRDLREKIKNLLFLNRSNKNILDSGKSDILRKNATYDIYTDAKESVHTGHISNGYYYGKNEPSGDPLGEIDSDGTLRFFAEEFGIHKLESAVIKDGFLTRDSDGIRYIIKERVNCVKN